MKPHKQMLAELLAVLALCLLPLALCLTQWRWVSVQHIPRWRRGISWIGLALATAASLVPPLWFVAMLLTPQGSEATPTPLSTFLLYAVLTGLSTTIPAAIGLCFGRGRVRWVGLSACGLSLLLFALSFYPAVSAL